jgi:heme/copper-type cytochrome/quinol oxidase subunit 2
MVLGISIPSLDLNWPVRNTITKGENAETINEKILPKYIYSRPNLIVPSFVPLKIYVTSDDVIHSFSLLVQD